MDVTTSLCLVVKLTVKPFIVIYSVSLDYLGAWWIVILYVAYLWGLMQTFNYRTWEAGLGRKIVSSRPVRTPPQHTHTHTLGGIVGKQTVPSLLKKISPLNFPGNQLTCHFFSKDLLTTLIFWVRPNCHIPERSNTHAVKHKIFFLYLKLFIIDLLLNWQNYLSLSH